MKINFNSLKISVLAGIFILLAYFLGTCERRKSPEARGTDTVYIDRVYTDTIIITKVTPPKVLTVYLKPNKPKRKQLERGTILQGLTINPKGVEVVTIDTAGLSRVAFYPVPIGAEVLVSDTGAVQVNPVNPKKARLIRAGKVAVVVIAFIAGAALF
jgi:hypothetical protein